MGLDNGITLVTKSKLNFENWESVPEYVNVTLDEWATEHSKRGYEYEVCYWRKCWNIRGEMLDILGAPQDGGVYRIDKPEQILDFRDALIEYLRNPEKWNDSIWSIDEFAPHLARDIMTLGWLHDYMVEHTGENFIVEFYDSY